MAKTEKEKAYAALRRAEDRYLLASGWTCRGGLWVDPLDPAHTHIDRVASNKQRQRDARALNRIIDAARRAETAS